MVRGRTTRVSRTVPTSIDDLSDYEPDYIAGLFREQRRFIRDKAKRKAAVCGRRGGKTECIGSWLRQGCDLRPGVMNLYVTLNQRSARRILWETLKKANRRWNMGLEFSDQNLIATAPSGGQIWCTGCDNQAAAENLRGLGYGRVAIDEAGSFPDWLEYLIEDVLDPALMDHDGELALIGSPGLIPIGYFYDRTVGDRPWSLHHWTCLQNPHLQGRAYLEQKKHDNRWDDNHPTYRREYLGLWVRDDSAIIYPFDPTKNIGTLPEQAGGGRVLRVLSVDLGYYPDSAAFVVGASIVGAPEWYCESVEKYHKLTITGIAARIEQIRYNCAKEGRPIDRLVVDAGALGKGYVESLRQDFGIACEAAEKRDKLANIHIFRGAMLAGTVKIAPLSCQLLREEWSLLAWNEDRDDHDERCVDDAADSSLYNYRAHNLHYHPKEEPPKPGTKAHDDAYIRDRKRELNKQIKKRVRGKPWSLPK